MLGLEKIRQLRRKSGNEPNEPLSNVAFIIRSLKHQDEVALLRKVYRKSFHLIAAYSPIEVRRKNLARDIAQSHHSAREDDYLSAAQELMKIDEAEVDLPFGQKVRDTYPLADVFVDVSQGEHLTRQLWPAAVHSHLFRRSKT